MFERPFTEDFGAVASVRSTDIRAILGPELHKRLANTRVLLVGAGGIGCELLKNVVLTGLGSVTLLDLDTIDVSNLNRQFLFRRKDVKQSKAMVAARTAYAFNPAVRINPIHANIKEPQFDVHWYRTFDIVLNALDNLGVPLVESGTAGYLGQVQPIAKGRTECFECLPKPVPKSFPVCTIRSTPSLPIHCIVWAKSYLMPQLFGEDEDGEELNAAEEAGENEAQEIENLRQEAKTFSIVRQALASNPFPNGTGSLTSIDGRRDPARLAFEKVFTNDIKNLLKMSDMWKSRSPPTPLDYDAISHGTFSLSGAMNAKQTNGSATNGAGASSSPAIFNSAVSAVKLKDQKELTLQENLILFVSSTHRLAARLRAGEETISFDKDDEDTLDFVTAASNLRSVAYGIPGKSRWEVKEMAGNIIPAIATTNAIIAGVIVLQALRLLGKNYSGIRNVHLQRKPEVPLSSVSVDLPSRECGVCADTYMDLVCDPERVTLAEAVNGILGFGPAEDEGSNVMDVCTGNGTGPRDVSVYEDKRLLADPDFDDNADRTLASLGVIHGKFLTIVDEDGEYGTIAAAILPLPPNHPHNCPPLILPSPLPIPPKKAKLIAPLPPSTPKRKRGSEADVGEGLVGTPPPAKRAKGRESFSTPASGIIDISSPSPSSTPMTRPPPRLSSSNKKQTIEDEGVIILDDSTEAADEGSVDGQGVLAAITIDDD